MAAVLSCGDRAALSHWAAAAHRGLLTSNRAYLDVTVPTRGGRVARRGIRVHRSSTLRPCDVEVVDGVPTTTVARTIFDLAGDRGITARRIERLLDEAEFRGLLDTDEVLEQTEHNRGRARGVRLLTQALETHTPGSTRTDGPIGEAALAIIRASGLPDPEVQLWIDLCDGGPMIRADFAWPHAKVILETDGRRAHGTANRIRRDRERDRRAAAAGWQTVRATWDQIREEPAALAARLLASVTSGSTDAAAA